MPDVVAAPPTERCTTSQIEAEPAADDTNAPLIAGRLPSGSSVALFPTVGALHLDRPLFIEDSGHPLVLSELLYTYEFCKLFLSLRALFYGLLSIVVVLFITESLLRHGTGLYN